jgi:hypothetical protein
VSLENEGAGDACGQLPATKPAQRVFSQRSIEIAAGNSNTD